jgi:hypothetical protein
VVDAEQVLEFLRLPGPAFHRVEQGELAVQQRLAAPGQVPEDVADALAQPGLAHGRFHRGLLDRVERLPDLPDLVRGGGQLGRLSGYVDVLVYLRAAAPSGSLLLASSGPTGAARRVHGSGHGRSRSTRRWTG